MTICLNCGEEHTNKFYCSRKCQMEGRKVHFNERYFEYIDHPVKMYWLGYIMGDGTVFCNKAGKRCRLVLECNKKDKKIVENFTHYIEVDQKYIKERPEHNSISLNLYSQDLVEDLYMAGIPRKNKSKNSKIIKHSEPKFQKAFLTGLFDADGHISSYFRSPYGAKFSLASGNTKILNDWIEFFPDWKITEHSGFKQNNQKKKWWTASKYVKRQDKQSFRYYYNFFYGNPKIPRLERKHDRMEMWT